MLHPTDNKENLKNANTLYSRDNNKSKINLLEPTLKSKSTINTLAFADEILFKIYQQRIKNKQLYDKIREVDSFFSYELRPQLKNYSHPDMQVKQYGMLLEEYELLEKHWTKIETLLHRNTQQQSFNFHFLIAPWQKIQKKCLENDSTQILQRLNKTVLVIKKEIDASLKSKTKYDENFTYRQFLMNSPQYLLLHKQLQRAQNNLKQKQEQLQSIKNQNEIVIQNYKKENETLSRKLEQLQTKLKQTTNKQKQLYFVMSKMSKQLLEADNKLQEYRSQKQYTKRYISTVNEGDNLSLFQILIKQKSDQLDKMNTFVTHKSIRKMEKYLNCTFNQQKKDAESRDQVFDKNNQGNASQEISKEPQPKQSSQKSLCQQTEQLCYSSTQKRKISAMRQIYSGSKLFPKRSNQDYESVAKEVKLMRKR